MKPEGIIQTITLPSGQEVTIETGLLAKQADGSVVVRCGNTMLLATVVANKEAKEDLDFLPLTVDYREKFASNGKYPGGFFKREARPYDYEVLISRLIDRAMRPLFPDDFHAETQILVTLISLDPEILPDSLAGLAASAAVAVSDIPFNGPISEVRVARVDGKYVINPRKSELEIADLEIMVAGSMDSIVMVEGEMKEVSEAEMLEAIKEAHKAIKVQIQAQIDLAARVPKAAVKREYNHEKSDPALLEAITKACYDGCYAVAKKGSNNKEERKAGFKAVKEAFLATLSEEEIAEKNYLINRYFHDVEKEAVRRCILDEGVRLDGRKTTDIRYIWGEVDYLPGTHGSAVFTRGETQSLTTLTLGSKLDEQMVDGVSVSGSESFMLHYNFPPFSTGEAKPMRGTGRREIGHGNLALRALKPVLPLGNENPYTIRIVSDILESNGSSSMATVCAGTLALMDGGVQISGAVSGIAMGLITDNSGKYAVLSDILGDEDHLGDMDFKVTGTAKGITACQMDLKIDGLNYSMLEQALEQARQGRLHILNELLKVIDKPRADYKEHAPRIVSFEVPKDTIGAIIGPGGKIIQEIQRETNTTIVIEEINEKGHVQIVSANKTDIDRAVGRVRSIAFPRVIEIGEVYEGKVKTIMPYGAFVEIIPGTDGLLHISELEWHKVEKVTDVINEGELVQIKITGKDPKTGKLKLSRKVLINKPENSTATAEA
ncbi:MAG TPA: polyribonucleotide nucleotidyltransferase [Luteibaculaceae bacterium]|nr:polyribonucleotide nucleotidyltransferase [Luteibaculaceae bacterium]